MIKEWQFELNERAIINEKAMRDLPSNIGDIVIVTEIIISPTFDYKVKLPNGEYTKVKEGELLKISEENMTLQYEINKQATYKPFNEIVRILKVDAILGQIEVEHSDGSMQVVNVNSLEEVAVQ